jgi:hypothetical protein
MKNTEIQTTHIQILHRLDELQVVQTQTHSQYKQYLESNKTNKIFGLDSFYYQSRLFDLELKQLKEHYSFVNNRIYCDYYKLYGMVKQFYKENFKLEPKKRNYIPYKDLEPYKLFEFTDSLNLDKDILEMIQGSFDIIKKREAEVKQIYRGHGVNIDNYIHNHHYNNESLKTKVELYEKYLRSYHIYHMSFLSNLMSKIGLLFGQTESTVSLGQVDGTVSNELMNSFIVVPPVEHVDKPVEPVEPVAPVEPVDKPVEAPAIAPVEPVAPAIAPVEPVAPAIAPVEAPVEPVAPVEAPLESPVEASVAPVETPVETPVEPVAQVESPVELAASVEAPVETPVETSVAQVEPVETPVEPVAPVESPVELAAPAEPVETPVEKPLIPSEVPVETPVDKPVEMPEAPVETPAVPEVHEKTKKKAKKGKK